jgi:Histidine kinase-, DNA gyrase B-, and HSP90-like ATPase
LDIPDTLKSNPIFQKVAQCEELKHALKRTREVAETLTSTLIRDAEIFTDHTCIHMDALWRVATNILTQEEIAALTVPEAYLLGTGFYLHDLGMAYAATEEGKSRIRTTESYRVALSALDPRAPESDKHALVEAVRLNHAFYAQSIATEEIPGLKSFLIEDEKIRRIFGHYCGEISASHHWDIDAVQERLAKKNQVQFSTYGIADVGYVAYILRIIDYAHINRDRANYLQRRIRNELPPTSTIHWDAQQDIDGPLRISGTQELQYSCATPIASIDAWWTFYDFVKGLDQEITQVRRNLDSRSISQNRFSLTGVRGAGNPEELSITIIPKDFLPLEIGIKTKSIDRLVKILAGESLYGSSPYTTIRELIQNAIDATEINCREIGAPYSEILKQQPIEVKINTKNGTPSISITDKGIGMDKRVLTDHLLTIASDYWDTQFQKDYPRIQNQYTPIGKFGIGFLSAFMLGSRVTVVTERKGHSRFSLTLHGLNKRAELRELPSTNNFGTTVEIQLNQDSLKALAEIEVTLPFIFPAISFPIQLHKDEVITTLNPSKYLLFTPLELKNWIGSGVSALRKVKATRKAPISFIRSLRFQVRGLEEDQFSNISRELEDEEWPSGAPSYLSESTRLVGSDFDTSLLCSKGIFINLIHTPGFCGIINKDDIQLTAARDQALDYNPSDVLDMAIASTKGKISENLSRIGTTGFIPEKLAIATSFVGKYGKEVLLDSEFPWLQQINRTGNSNFINTKQLRELCRMRTNVIIGISIGPNSLSKAWANMYKACGDETHFAICFPDIHVAYQSGTMSGTLKELDFNFEQESFLLFINELANNWEIPVNELIDKTVMHRETSSITGIFAK